MSDPEIIPLELFCSRYNVERNFLEMLEAHGLIALDYRESEHFILQDDLAELEKYSRLYYELKINVPGIEALQNMLDRVKQLQDEKENLLARLRIYE